MKHGTLQRHYATSGANLETVTSCFKFISRYIKGQKLSLKREVQALMLCIRFPEWEWGKQTVCGVTCVL